MMRRQETVDPRQFKHMDNRTLLWGLLQENYGAESLT